MLDRVVHRPSDGAAAGEVPDTDADPPEITFTSGDVRRKAFAGVLLVGLRTFAVRGLGLLGNLVLARLLFPEDFGVLAIGQTVIMFGDFLADAGIAAGLVRRKGPPSRRELQTILGFQVLVAVLFAAAVAAIAVPQGHSGQVIALMAGSIAFHVYRAPANVVLVRRLDYRAIASVEVAESLVFVAWSVTAASLGAGVWGVATAYFGRAIVGSVLMVKLSPVRVLSPRLSPKIMRELLPYGAVVQAGYLVQLLHGQSIIAATGAVAGLSVLGLYSLADRIMQLPWLVFESLIRVAFPAMSRLVAAGEDATSDLDRGLRLLTVCSGALLCLVAATSPVLISVLFGAKWQAASGPIPLIALGLLLGGPIIAVCSGYLYAVGDARHVLMGSIASLVIWFPVALPLLPVLGATAVGAGQLAGYVVEGAVLARAVHARTGLRAHRITAAPALALILAGGIGFAVARRLEPSLLAVVGVAGLTTVLLSLTLLVAARTTLAEGWRLGRTLLAQRRAPAG
jgi:O-antigen/teichoic acid export membrane protein